MLNGTPNFSVGELLRASTGGAIPTELEDNAQAVAEWLQSAWEYLGRPMLVTSLYRSSSANAATLGAANDSQHRRALAADFDVMGLTNAQAAARLRAGIAAGAIPMPHQIITYTTDHHLHVGIAGETWGADNGLLLETAVGQYATLSDAELASLAGATSVVAMAGNAAAQASDVARSHPIAAAVAAFLLMAPAFGARIG